jgi:hypothetical protein
MCITRINLYARTAAALFALATVMSACTDAPDPEEAAHKRCMALRTHLIDLRLATASASVDVSAHRKAFEEALGERFLDDCRQLPQQQVECSLRANDSAAASECADTHE